MQNIDTHSSFNIHESYQLCEWSIHMPIWRLRWQAINLYSSQKCNWNRDLPDYKPWQVFFEFYVFTEFCCSKILHRTWFNLILDDFSTYYIGTIMLGNHTLWTIFASSTFPQLLFVDFGHKPTGKIVLLLISESHGISQTGAGSTSIHVFVTLHSVL